MRAPIAIVAVLGALAASPAEADFPRKTPRISLMQVLAGAKQALLLDRTSGEYQVVKVGDAVQGFRVTEIDEDQIVVASPFVAERYFVLPLAEPPPAPPPAGAGAATGTAAPAAQSTAPGPAASGPVVPVAPGPPAPDGTPPAGTSVVDPEADVLDPYSAGEGQSDPAGPAEPVGIPSVIAPPASRVPAAPAPPAVVPTPAPPVAAQGTRPDPGASIDEIAAPPIEPKVTTVKPTEVRPAAPSSPAGAGPAPQAEQPRKLSRRQLDTALADFSALARQMRIERAAGGGVRILELEKGSFVAQLGIERGDVVRRVAGLPIDSIDQAAAAYAALASAKDVLVELDRRGAPLRIRYQLTR